VTSTPNCLVRSINCKPGHESIELSTLPQPLRLGEAVGAVDGDRIRREMIRQTIIEHLDKELRLTSRGVKVLSLFFIDAVEHYRRYENGVPVKGKYAVMFEEEYKKAIKTPKYSTLFRDVDTRSLPAAVHDGYFSIDKKGLVVDTGEGNQVGRDNAERGYALIMKDKERLLGFQTPLKFIFSHSALREGWDNPNVFQICTLREMGTERERRQTLGRGLRLCVDQSGQRLRDRAVNTLTVIATEGYEEFAANLQHEIEEDTGIRFGIVASHQFAAVVVATPAGELAPLGVDQSEAIWKHLAEQGHIDAKGEVQDSLRTAIKENAVTLPADCPAPLSDVVAILRKLSGGLDIKNARERRTVKVRHSVLDGEPFRALWDRIKDKTTYRVAFDNAALISDCTKAVAALPAIPPTRLQLRTADLTIDRGGVTAEATSSAAPIVIAEPDLELPDLLTFLQNQTRLTRRSLAKILIDSGRLEDFRVNPQRFISLATEAVNRAKQLAVVDGIRYQRVGDDSYYAQELFEQTELTGYLKNMVAAEKAVHEQVIYDSAGVERVFAEQLEQNGAVKVYAKLPGWFTVPTPLGTYNPDWAVLVDDGGTERLYFVVETKSSLFEHDLRAVEGAKIACGKAHFAALTAKEPAPRYVVARTLSDVFSTVPSPRSGGKP
jgi:type III restriction enzyme